MGYEFKGRTAWGLRVGKDSSATLFSPVIGDCRLGDCTFCFLSVSMQPYKPMLVFATSLTVSDLYLPNSNREPPFLHSVSFTGPKILWAQNHFREPSLEKHLLKLIDVLGAQPMVQN